MLLDALRWLGKNLGSLLLAFVLALIVWISAVTTADPNVERDLTRPVEIKVIGKAAELKLMQTSQLSVKLKLKAPRSLWEQVNSDPTSLHAWIDLSGLGPGNHQVPVQVEIDPQPVRLITQDPLEVSVELEQIVNEIRPVLLNISGKPPVGYRMEDAVADPAEAIISGPASLITQVIKIQASLDVQGATDTITQTVNLVARDVNDQVVNGITISPAKVTIRQPISLLGGYRNVIVKVVTQGNVASGYRLTNYYASPSSVVVFSTDPTLVEVLPGYVETAPLDLDNATDDFEALLELNLPAGVTVVTDPRVLVQVSIAAIESSLTISLPIDVIGLSPNWQAQIAPATVDVILSGPVPVLNNLRPENIRVKVDLSGFEAGTHQIIPVIDFLPDQVQKISILPATVEVTIVPAPTPTPTPLLSETPSTPTPTPGTPVP